MISAILFAALFEKCAIVDNFDMLKKFDVETATGTVQIVEYVLTTGATSIWWRPGGLATPRYPSRVARRSFRGAPEDKRRVPSNRSGFGWLSMDEPDTLKVAAETCRRRGVRFGLHWPYEDSHWSSDDLSRWNLDHPQFRCRKKYGAPIAARASMAFPETIGHKLEFLEELLAYGPDTIFIDLYRSGGWTPAWEYVTPMCNAWRAAHGTEPPDDPRDPRWLRMVAERQHAFFRAVRARLDRSPTKIRLVLGVNYLGRDTDFNLVERGVDWRQLVREGVVDALMVMCISPDPGDLWGSTERIYRETVAAVDGRCPVLFPALNYNFAQRFAYIEYAKRLDIPRTAALKRLLEIARDAGGAGVAMEVVDYGNYRQDECRAISVFR